MLGAYRYDLFVMIKVGVEEGVLTAAGRFFPSPAWQNRQKSKREI